MNCPSCCCCNETMTKVKLRSLYFSLFLTVHRRGNHEGTQDRNLEAGTEAIADWIAHSDFLSQLPDTS